MPFIRDAAFDLALGDINAGTRIDITVGEATNYTEATGIYNGTTQLSCGNETAMTVGAPAPAGAGTGRQVTVPAITDGDATATQTASHWALTDGAILYATGALDTPQAVTDGNKFTLDAIIILIRDAIATP